LKIIHNILKDKGVEIAYLSRKFSHLQISSKSAQAIPDHIFTGRVQRDVPHYFKNN